MEASARDELSTSAPMSQLSQLPVAVKLQILDLVQQNRGQVLDNIKPDSPQLLPVVTFPNIEESALSLLSLADVRALETTGYVIKDNFLKSLPSADHSSLNDAASVLQDARKLRENGMLTRAAMSRAESKWRDEKVRGDEILWLNDTSKVKECSPSLFSLLSLLDDIRKELNKACAFNSQHTQSHLTCYPGAGSRYVRHYDAYQGGPSRRITALYYCNDGWRPEHGGCLRLYLSSGPKDVEPIGDRLLLFQSRSIEHEVLPTHAERYAVTMWYY